MSSFVQGLQAGSNAVMRGLDIAERKKASERADKEYERQEQFRNELSELQRQYYAGDGDFAQGGRMVAPGTAPTGRRGLPIDGMVDPGDFGGATELPAAQPAGNAVNRDKLFYQRMQEVGSKYLPPEKAMAWSQGVEQLAKQNYADGMLKAFRGAMAGDRNALATLAQAYEGIENGHNLDFSMARWDPKNSRWVGVLNVYEDGSREPTVLGREELARGFEMLSPASAVSSMVQRKQLDLEARKVATGERQAETAATSAAAQANVAAARLQFDREKLAEEISSSRALARYRMDALNLDRQKVELQRSSLEGDERARDMLTRQKLFESSFVPPIKLDELSSDEDRARVEDGRSAAALATSIYALSTEGVDGKSRNAVQAEVDQFVRGLMSKSLDSSKLVRGKDGVIRYGRVVVPASLVAMPEASGGATGSW